MNKAEQELLDYLCKHTFTTATEREYIAALIHAVWQSGMKDAAEIAGARQYNGVDSYGHAFVEGCKTTQQAILTAANKP